MFMQLGPDLMLGQNLGNCNQHFPWRVHQHGSWGAGAMVLEALGLENQELVRHQELQPLGALSPPLPFLPRLGC